jgi:hypothetical protein
MSPPSLSFLSILLSIVAAQCTQLTMACSTSRVASDGSACFKVIGVHFVNLTGASSDVEGGALFITTSSTVLLSESTFVACFLRTPSVTTYGGGCSLVGMAQATVQNCCATRCFATVGQFLRVKRPRRRATRSIPLRLSAAAVRRRPMGGSMEFISSTSRRRSNV